MLASIAAVFLLVPLLDLFRTGGPSLWPDTLAQFGAGSTADVPIVTRVHCSHAHDSRTHSHWACDLTLDAAPTLLKRELQLHDSGWLTPRLRRLSAGNGPRDFGVAWNGGELAWRWFDWVLGAVVNWMAGGLLLRVSLVVWRRATAPR